MNSVLFAAIRSRKPIWLPRDHWNVWITMCQAFRKLTVRGFPCQHSYIINLSLSAHYSRPIALRGKQAAAIQVRLLVSTRKSCRETLMVKKNKKYTLSIPDPLLLKGLFLQQALSSGNGRVFQAAEGKPCFLPRSRFTWLRDRLENSDQKITVWFLSLRKSTLTKGSNGS